MPKPSDQLAELERLWLQRFGQPPPVRDAKAMKKVLQSLPAEPAGKPQ